MEPKSKDIVVEDDRLEEGLLSPSQDDYEDETILYSASFEESEEKFVQYQTVEWILYSLLLILAWGIGFFMLLYLPVRRYVLRKDIRSRKLYLTHTAIVYKVTRPVSFPCFGVLKKEKHVLLPSVADIVIEQGYLQSLFGIYSIRIENTGVRRPPSDDVHVKGITNPRAFRKAVLTHISNMKREAIAKQASTHDDISNFRIGPSFASMTPSKFLTNDSPYHTTHISESAILQKVDELGSSVKRVQTLIEEGQHET